MESEQEKTQRIISFYNKESPIYSEKRYFGEATSHTKFFFQCRLKIVLDLVREIIKGKENLTLLDIACADGIITQELAEKYPSNFRALVGNDIAPQMIEVANSKNRNPKVRFFTKHETPSERYDIVLGLGFMSGSILAEEVDYAASHLKDDGVYICTLVSKYSIMALLKLRKEPYYKDYWSYKRQEEFLKQDFEIVKAEPCGFFAPVLWKFPAIARKVQPVLEMVFKPFPNLYQEKIYVLRKRIS